jgi:23S rRNA pseudouridine1911/1915/1917 synthase
MSGPEQGSGTGVIEVVVAPENAGQRLDRALTEAIGGGLSRSRLQALVRDGAVTLDGRTISDPGSRVKSGEHYRLEVPEPEPATPAPEAIALDIVYEDEHLIVVDKPAGLVVHPAAGHASGTLVNALIAHCGTSLSGIGGVRRPGIVHRLDKDTSGLIVVAKTDAAHQGLAAQFKSHGADGRLERRYLALVWGAPERQRGTIEAPLARSTTQRTRIAVTHAEHGRRAVTHYETLERFIGADGKPVASLIALTLETGRTHQIRVHMAHAGHPVMGDPVYATGFRTRASRLSPQAREALARLDRQALHAALLIIEHPTTGRRLSFESKLPPDIAGLLEALRAEAPRRDGLRWRKRRI